MIIFFAFCIKKKLYLCSGDKIPRYMETDSKIIANILSDNEKAIRQFFFEECEPIFLYIIRKVFDCRIEKDELINELYIYLKENEWHKLRQLDCHNKLKTWVAKVALHFFIKKRDKLIKNESSEHLITEQIAKDKDIFVAYDAENLLKELKNKRYRFVIQKLVLEDREPKEIASEMGITVNNLYKIKCLALRRLEEIIKKEMDYVKYFRDVNKSK